MPLNIFQVSGYTEILRSVWAFIKPFDWLFYVILVIVFFLVLKDSWLFYVQQKYRKSLDFGMLEIKIPRAIEKGPRAMEQFFASLYSMAGGPRDKREKYSKGTLLNSFSLDMVGQGGKVALYIWTQKKLIPTIESILYAQYPDIEISHVDDYVNILPSTYDKFESLGYDLWGEEYLLDKSPAYPILGYKDLENREGTERIVDPISLLLEVMGKLKDEELLWLQFIVRPTGKNWDWAKIAGPIIKEIKEKGLVIPAIGEEGQESLQFKGIITPGETQKLKLVEEKISKSSFETLIRYIYFAPKEVFNKDLPKSGIASFFAQFSIGGVNKLKFNGPTITAADWQHWPFLFPKRRARTKKENMFRRYRKRYLPEETLSGRIFESGKFNTNLSKKISVLSSEELATLYHPPTDIVLTAPTLETIESKKVSPPSFLPY